MSNDDSFKASGRTQALDIDDFEAQRKRNLQEPDEWASSSKGWDDPWSGNKERTWAQDERWTGDDGTHKAFGDGGGHTMALDLADLSPRAGDGALPDADPMDKWNTGGGDQLAEPGGKGGPRGWSAPKRDELLASGGDDWNDGWSDGGGGGGESTMALALDDIEEEAKETGARRKRQAAVSYERDSSSAYGDGKAKRRDLYRSKEDAEAEGRGLQAYGGGRREVYGQHESFDNGDWSSSPGARRPAPASMQASMPGAGQPSTLPPSERTVALDLDGSDFSGGGGNPGTLSPNESTVALDDYGAIESLVAGGAGGGPAQQVGPCMGALVIFTPENPPVPYELGPGVTSVGRGLDNDVVLSDPFTSRKHFLVVQREGQFEVRDSGTDNGTCVNGHRVTQALLRPGDHIEVGNTVLRFVPGTPGPNDMHFSPPPPVPPHHLAPPPDGSMMQPMPGMMPPGMDPNMMGQPLQPPPPKKKTGLIIGLVLGVLVLVGGGVTAAVLLTGGDDKKSSKSEDVSAEGSTELDGSTGYVEAGVSDGEGKLKQAMQDHEESGDDGSTGAAATAGTAGDKTAAPSGDGGATAAPATATADPVLVAGLVGSSAMATGQSRPLKMTLAGEAVDIKIDTDPTDAEIYDQHGNLIGRTPYHITQIKADLKATWTVKKAGHNPEDVDVDFSTGTEVELDLGAKKKKPRTRRNRDRDRPTSTSIPTVD